MQNSAKHETADSREQTGLNHPDLHALAIESLPCGIVIFDENLKILTSNRIAGELIDIDKSFDKSLSNGTDQKIWGNWGKPLKECISLSKKCRFDSVAYAGSKGERLLQITVSPLGNSNSICITGGVAVLENITEKTNIQKHLAGTERMAVLGRQASKIAHELNNPIDGIMRYIGLAARAIEAGDRNKPLDYLEHARRGLERMTYVITELLEFSRSQKSVLRDTPLDEILNEAIKSLEHRTQACGIKFVRDYHRPLPMIKSTVMFQVFVNLIKNAIDVMPDGGTITVSCRLEDEHITLIEIRDTGPGFAPENSEAMFEPFFTTKPHGKGTGLGLAVCKDIIEKYGGSITAENSPDCGSVFTIRLPIS